MLDGYESPSPRTLLNLKVFNWGVSNDSAGLRGVGGKYLATSMARQVHKYMQSVLCIH